MGLSIAIQINFDVNSGENIYSVIWTLSLVATAWSTTINKYISKKSRKNAYEDAYKTRINHHAVTYKQQSTNIMIMASLFTC